MECLLDFFKEKPFKIVELDKNVGVGIMSYQLDDLLCSEHISKDSNYLSIASNHISRCISEINSILHDLHLNKHISMKLFKSLKLDINLCKAGSFRALPKIHKTKFSIRPIFNCINQITSNICALIDIILRPFVYYCEYYLKDSQQLLQEAENLRIPASCKLYSWDFDSLYTNINLKDALVLLSDFIKDKFFSSHIDITGFNRILELVFTFNYFKYKEKHF